MRIELINWSGHNNFGDDVMADLLLYYFPDAVNVGEHPTETADWYILGGGTLISPQSLFLARSPNPKKTIGISLGVSSNWAGEGVEFLKQFPLLFVRDIFSFKKLKEYGVECILSVDLLLALDKGQLTHVKHEYRVGVAANIMYPFDNPSEVVLEHVNRIKNELKGPVHYFALCDKEDLQTVPGATLYKDPIKLLWALSHKATIIATRLHANVLAWYSGCKNITTIHYDPKISHFFERVKGLTPGEAHKIIMSDLKKIYEYIYYYPNN